MRYPLFANYTARRFKSDLLAGVTVGIVALPLSMALAIASGVPPQHGIYTSIFGGILIALTGGSRFNVSGPTAAFVVVLLPISQQFGLGGLMTASIFGGGLLVVMGFARLGGVIRLIPYPVVIGFTSGIGTVIAGLQLKDLLGLEGILEGGFAAQVYQVAQNLGGTHWPDALIGLTTLAVLLLFPKLKWPIPAHLVAVLVGTLASLTLTGAWGVQVKTLGSEFQYVVNGVAGQGVPSVLPSFALPWALDGILLDWTPELLRALLVAGFTIAMLGAIESLLCAVVADGMTGTSHDPNRELIGQGLGNLVGPFFGAIPATAALARTAANIRAGGTSPLSSVVHGLFLLVTLLSLSQGLSYIPMATLAALLLVVAWNMAEVKHFLRILKVAPRRDVTVLLTCYVLTVLIDMVVAVGVGISLASILFIRRMAVMSGTKLVGADNPQTRHLLQDPDIMIYEINGPMFFGAAQKAVSALRGINRKMQVMLLDLSKVGMMDMTGLVAFESLIEDLKQGKTLILLCGAPDEVRGSLDRAGIREIAGVLAFLENLEQAPEAIARLRREANPQPDSLKAPSQS